jgi:hypothetical protein
MNSENGLLSIFFYFLYANGRMVLEMFSIDFVYVFSAF